MAVDWVLHYLCQPKEAFGGGDFLAGTDRLLECLKARHRADAIAEIARRDGESPAGKSVTIRVAHADGDVNDREVTYEDLVREADQLKPHEPACAGCPANVLGKPFGCIGVINYPIRKVGEEWLVNRLQPSSAVGGKLFLAAIRDFGYTGEPLRQYRTAGLFEAGRPLTKKLKKGFFGGDAVTSDQLFQAIFCIGEPLDPGHCLGILMWLGCLRLDGAVVETPEQALAVSKLEGAKARAEGAQFDVGEPAADPAVRPMQLLLKALYSSWVLKAPLWVSA